MESIIKELWHGNIIPQEDSRTNSKEMKELLGYMSRHHEDFEPAVLRHADNRTWYAIVMKVSRRKFEFDSDEAANYKPSARRFAYEKNL